MLQSGNEGGDRMAAIKASRSNRIMTVLNYGIMLLIGAATLFPFYITIINSISPPEDFYFKDIILWPSRFDTSYYQLILTKGSDLFNAYKVTLFVTFVGTLVNMMLTTMTSFVLAQRKLPYRSQITLFIVFTMFFHGGMIPSFLLVQGLRLTNTLWAMIIPGAIGTGYMLFLRNFFMTIPVELYESAYLDGCSEARILTSIILPLSLPALAAFTLFYAVDHWNDFYAGTIYIIDYRKQPLQVYLRGVLYDATVRADPETMARLMGNGELRYQPPSEALKAATVIAATLPIIMVYPFLQKYFVKGMMMGSLKG